MSRRRSTSATVLVALGRVASAITDEQDLVAVAREDRAGRPPATPGRPRSVSRVGPPAPSWSTGARPKSDQHLDRAHRARRRAPARRARSRRGSRSPPGTSRSPPCPPSATAPGAAISSISAVAPIANGSGRFISVCVQRSQKPGPVLGLALAPQPADDLARLGHAVAEHRRSAPAAASPRPARRSRRRRSRRPPSSARPWRRSGTGPASATITVTPENVDRHARTCAARPRAPRRGERPSRSSSR